MIDPRIWAVIIAWALREIQRYAQPVVKKRMEIRNNQKKQDRKMYDEVHQMLMNAVINQGDKDNG